MKLFFLNKKFKRQHTRATGGDSHPLLHVIHLACRNDNAYNSISVVAFRFKKRKKILDLKHEDILD